MNEPVWSDGIAIVGMAGRFPGANDVSTFWRNVCEGVESITRFAPDELEDAFPATVRASRDYVAARAILENVDQFDASFFGITSYDAERIDPQARVILECSWEALEDAGYDPTRYAGRIGVVAGCTINTYALRTVFDGRSAVDRFTSDYQVGSFPELLGAGQDFLATRIAYKLNLRGPASTVQSACSTSLLAVSGACQALLSGQADIMLAGAVSITFPQKRGYIHQAGGMVSADGHCRTFDAAATGTVFGDGAGVVVLKRLADAVEDRDRIYAVIRGIGVTNDGGTKAGFTAPSAAGQSAAIRAAYRTAGFDPRSIGYVECHGTATPLGDPIEFAALMNVFPAPEAGPYCTLGSVKPNIGHLDIAAGMSGLIKTTLALHHRTLPPTLHYTTPNPRIPISGSPFSIESAIADWPKGDAVPRAGVSAFGVGGTNVHVALEAAPPRSRPATDRPQLIVVSAASETALERARARLADALESERDGSLADVAFTLQTGRRAFARRIAITATTKHDAVASLRRPQPVRHAGSEPALAFMFPGQGSQYPGMGRDLYRSIPLFRETIERCAAIAAPIIGEDLTRRLYDGNDASCADLTATSVAQPAIFAVEYALAEVWRSWGIVPAAMIGHSVGEFVAATIAGVLSLDDALGLVAERGRLMQTLPAGAMLAVRLSGEELRPHLSPLLSVAAANAPNLSVAAGPIEAIDALERALSAADIACRRLPTSHAFHSSMVEPILEPLARCMRAVSLNAPRIPYISGVSGEWITAEQATSADYWIRHCRETIDFAAGVRTLIAGDVDAFLEVGPGNALATCTRQTRATERGTAILSSLRTAAGSGDDIAIMLGSLGELWSRGAAPNWPAVHAADAPARVSLPTYPFERKRFWIERADVAASTAEIASPPRLESIPLTNDQPTPLAPDTNRNAAIERELMTMLEELSGETVGDADRDMSFLELGFDSLFLGRFVQKLGSAFGTTVTFRALTTELPSIAALAAHIAASRPAAAEPVAAAPAIASTVLATASHHAPNVTAPIASTYPASSAFDNLVREQLTAMQQLMRDQLAALQNTPSSAAPSPVLVPAGTAPALPLSHAPSIVPAPSEPKPAASPSPAVSTTPEAPSRFDVYRPGAHRSQSEITPEQRAHIADLVARTTSRTRRSKELTARHRAVLADPRVAAGFRSEWKEMVYPIACDRAQGARLVDVDGNEYIDILNGFGQTAFGHSPEFVVDAVAAQLRDGFPIGPQTPLAGEVAELFCELTGNERVTFCNTGSEAVMAALRLARTVTGRDRVVMFSGAYHGQFDEVLVKAARNSARALPVAPGIPVQSVANMVVLPYADRASLEWVREHAGELAAVVVEPVQSRHPDLQPKAFLTEIRAITRASGTAFVIDEVVTGFRMHPGGMQAVFDIRADMATYGKVVGGGMPIGILAGTARFMDALDGGPWQYGDDSSPDVPPTFFAGTFVRHPLVMAAVFAVLRHLKTEGHALQAALSARTGRLVARLNADLAERGIATRIETYGSLFYFNLAGEERLASLLYYHLRLRGIYIQEGFPCFLTTAHSEADVDAIVAAFAGSFDELQTVGIFGYRAAAPAVEIPLTEPQTEIWLAAQYGDDASCAFNESITLTLDGPLDAAAFARAWDGIIARHDAVRATFSPTGEFFRIAPALTLDFDRIDLTTRDEAEAAGQLADLVTREAATPFDLVGGPLVRGALVRLRPERHAFVFTANHIICDGWSINVMLEEFAQLYTAEISGSPAALATPMAFRTYALSRRERDVAETQRVEDFWLAEFADPVRALDLPADRPRPAIRSFRGATRSMAIGSERYRAVKKAGARQGCTLFVTLLSAFGVLMGRLADTRDVVIGVPAAGQALLDGATLVGHCVDFLPIRARWECAATLADVLGALKARVLAAYEHQDYTLGTLVRTLAPVRETNRVPLAEIQFNLERLAERLDVADLSVTTVPNAKAFVNFDVFLNVIESDDGLRLDCDYNTDLFDATTIDRWLTQYSDILDALVENPALPVDAVVPNPVALAAGSHDGAGSHDNVMPFDRDATIVSLIAANAGTRPAAIAARCDDAALTYAQLEARSTSLARSLRRTFGAGGGRIAVCLPRSLDLLIALVATLKAGFTYVPLDPTHPPARLRHILDDAAVSAVITNATFAATEALRTTPAVLVSSADDTTDDDAAADLGSPRAETVAYAIYTSGSTGKPKGVEIRHRSVVNFLTSMAREPGITPSDTLLAVTTVAFDIAALELYGPLVAGGTVVIATDNETHDGFALRDRLRESHATMMQATPATWRLLLEADFTPPPGFKMLCGGEALRRDLASDLIARGGELWNMYGPTETTIWSACGRVRATGPITVGRPIANTTFFILDDQGARVAAGTPGHLHIGGEGVAAGYLHRTELTAEKFVAGPAGAGRLYRTGDTARVLPDGEYEILGRLDDQVKLRGYRIELGEIEATLTGHGAVAAVSVLLQEAEQRLVAYYVERSDAPAAEPVLRAIAAAQLPEYMIPSVWIRLDALPLNANGKVDRAALPAPTNVPDTGFMAAQTPTERALAEIWADVLVRERIGVDDDIFRLGADSIQIFQITARANRRGLPVLAKHVMKHRTIAALAKTIDLPQTADRIAEPVRR